jgi:hypothetical protein
MFFKRLCFSKDYVFLMGQAVGPLVEALRYNAEGRGFDYQWFPAAVWHWVRLSV